MKGRSATKVEKERLNVLEQFPCLVCEVFFAICDTPAEIHHLRGQRIPGAHLYTIALCSKHHRHKDNQKPPRWISRHGDGKAMFEETYAEEARLLLMEHDRVEQFKINTSPPKIMCRSLCVEKPKEKNPKK